MTTIAQGIRVPARLRGSAMSRLDLSRVALSRNLTFLYKAIKPGLMKSRSSIEKRVGTKKAPRAHPVFIDKDENGRLYASALLESNALACASLGLCCASSPGGFLPVCGCFTAYFRPRAGTFFYIPLGNMRFLGADML